MQLTEAVSQLEGDLDAALTEAKTKEELHNSCCEKVTSLEQALKDHGKDRENRLTSLEKQIKSIKQQLSVSGKELKVGSDKPVFSYHSLGKVLLRTTIFLHECRDLMEKTNV